ncbi:MAG: geranylgeranylglyceryl/heptaprenylglyceryl phosphate synthase [Bacteroidales bacterium]|nr:geranylgeranylglyceryl/heptaprenylglyceryl phosphate synthase [Bacteroidales bacterium]
MNNETNRIYNDILARHEQNQKTFAWLIDPDRYQRDTLTRLRDQNLIPHIILVGGSFVSTNTVFVVRDIKSIVADNSHVVLFPGDISQLSPNADALLLLSLVSGRNPEFLIGQHVKAAPHIQRMNIETIPTAYILIDGGTHTSVEYISATSPIPANKPELAVATALAAQQLGMSAIYLEAGSGAINPVSNEIISQVRNATRLPLFVGGGLQNADELDRVFQAGADIAVVGTLIERHPQAITDIMKRLTI